MSGVVRFRRPRAPFVVPLAPLVDVLLILLIFFMVTSTYLDLDMIPLAETAAEPPSAAPVPGGAASAAGVPVLVRLDAAGRAAIGGARLDGAGVAAEIARRLSQDPVAPVIILPSPRASTQSLVSLLDAVASGGAARLSILRFEDGPQP